MSRDLVIIQENNFFSDKTQLSTNLQSEESIQIWAWLNQGHFSDRTKKTYIRIVKDFLTFNWHLSLKQITPALVTLYLRKKDKVAASTRNLHRNCLSSLFQYLENVSYIQKSPVKVVKQEKVTETFHYKVLSIEQIKRMTEKVGSSRDRLVLQILYFTGLRVSELSTIKVKDFSVSSQKRNTQGAYLTVVGKGSKIRTVLTGAYLWKEIRKYIKKADLQPNDYIFNFEGAPLSRITIFKIIKKATQVAGIKVPGGKTPSPHWFRHTSAIHALENGADIHVVQTTLGHASLATTGQYLKSRPVKSNASYLKKV
ncbi:tyrosine-type recombinase/integrase [Pseudobdellovibrio sp. HCB154]|uniref:tyrosine-type recombinase/integrase n=1 Tax=Pseudobdellovibrio sp. HCB154 TaxID=3386277 RepID=UPI0039170145